MREGGGNLRMGRVTSNGDGCTHPCDAQELDLAIREEEGEADISFALVLFEV